MPTSKQNNNGTNHNPGCLAGLLRLLGIKPRQAARIETPEPDGALPYRLRDDFLSNAEASFYQVIQGMLGGYLTVCPKVSLSDILYVPRRNENYQAYHNKIDRKHVDFLICEPKTMRPRFAIELDDASHHPHIYPFHSKT
jgi:hypothetical protein